MYYYRCVLEVKNIVIIIKLKETDSFKSIEQQTFQSQQSRAHRNPLQKLPNHQNYQILKKK